MKKYTILFLLTLAACGGVDVPSWESLQDFSPRVVAVEPAAGTVVDQTAPVTVEFSEPVESATINNGTLAIVKDDSEDAKKIVESIVKGDVSGVNGNYELNPQGNVAKFTPEEPYEAGAKYRVVLTNKITSLSKVPLVGASSDTRGVFVSTFSVKKSSTDASSGSEASGASNSAEDDSTIDETPAIVRPLKLVINELLYDVTGDDTNGQVFVELFGDPDSEISGYKINFVGGSDGLIKETIKIGDGAIIPADGIFLIADSKTGQSGVTSVVGADFVDNFDPPNGPDCVQLLDHNGVLLDSLGYGSPLKVATENGMKCFEGAAPAKVSAGSSLSRVNGSDTGNNQADFIALPSPTPGVK